MKKGDLYEHFKGKIYRFIHIALPVETRFFKSLVIVGTARYHENTHDFVLYEHLETKTLYINANVPHVIYQPNIDSQANVLQFAREVDDFFGYKNDKGTLIKRFTLLHDNKE